MKRLVSLAILALGLVFALASAAPPAGEDDASTSRRDAGSTDRTSTDRASGQDTGGSSTWNADNYGLPCTSDTQCPGGKCFDIFGGSGESACFKTCTTSTDCSDFPFPSTTLDCVAVETGATNGICYNESAQNGPCGNVVNAGCVEGYGLCLMDSSGYGLCARICLPNNPASCASTQFASVCGCQGSDTCTDPWTSAGDGICAPTTTLGAACGYDNLDTGHFTPCTTGYECEGITQSQPTGTCQVPAVDGGSPSDASSAG